MHREENLLVPEVSVESVLKHSLVLAVAFVRLGHLSLQSLYFFVQFGVLKRLAQEILPEALELSLLESDFELDVHEFFIKCITISAFGLLLDAQGILLRLVLM